MKKAASFALGCKVNQYESEAIAELFAEKGYEIVGIDEEADVYVINTCTVTNFGDKKSRQLIRKVKRQNENAIVAVVGCYAQTAPKELMEIAGVNLVIGTKDRAQIVEMVEQYDRANGVENHVSDIMKERVFEPLSIQKLANRTRAYLKIQDGCSQYCSYCIIPYARGPIRSREPQEVVAEVKRLAENGFKEVVLTGIHVASYGKDRRDTSLLDILKQVHEVEGIERIRFSSIEPNVVTEEFAQTMAALPKVCDHFHLSLQSGCDKTLKEMNRKYDTARYMESCDLLRQYFDDPAITTDLITGFPEETEEEFAQTLDFIARVGFADMHVFPYSIRPGTKAAEMRQIDMPVREERAARASAVAKTMHEAYLACCVGKTFPVLFERDRKGGSAGHAPNYMEVSVAQEGLHNQVKNVKITAVDGGSLRGELEE
mgnify:CR=1 FL=1